MKKTVLGSLLMSIAFGLGAGQDPDRMRALESKLEELQKRLDALSGAADAELRRDLEELRRQIDALTREIETLKSGVPEKAATEASQVPGLGPAASKVYRSDRGVSIGGYGEVLYQNFDRRRDDGTPSGESDRLDLLRAVFYFGYKFDDRFLFNSEIEYEHASTGEGSEEKGEVSVEFAYLDYLLGKSRTTGLRAGLVLIPVGFINELHEPPIFLGARRPDLERRVLPATWREVGVGAFGQSGPVVWRGYVVNGLDASGFSGEEPLREGRGGGSNALAEDVAFTGRVDYLGLAGAVAGISGYSGGSGQDREVDGRRLRGRVSLWDVHAEWRARGFQARAIYTRGTIGDAGRINRMNGLSGDESVPESFGGGYAEAGYDVLFHRRATASLVPFLRFEEFDTQRRIPAGFSADPANEVRSWTLGVNYRPIPQVVVKADYQNFENRAHSANDQWNLAIGWIF